MTLLSHSFQVRHLILAAALTTSLGFVNPADAQNAAFLVDLDSRTAIDLGTLSGGSSYAFGINDTGQVVGYSSTPTGYDQAFITSPDGMGMRGLGTLGGSGSYAVSTMQDRWLDTLARLEEVVLMPSSPAPMEGE